MGDVNVVVLIGRLVRDSSITYTSGGTAVCKFSLAVNRRKKSGDQWIEEASFFDVVLWGRSGEAVNQYLLKGKQIAVSGSLVQERWEKDGKNHSRVEINAETVQLLGGGQNAQGAAQNHPDVKSYHPADPTQQTPLRSTAQGHGDGFQDDIPF